MGSQVRKPSFVSRRWTIFRRSGHRFVEENATNQEARAHENLIEVSALVRNLGDVSNARRRCGLQRCRYSAAVIL